MLELKKLHITVFGVVKGSEFILVDTVKYPDVVDGSVIRDVDIADINESEYVYEPVVNV